MLCSLQGVSGSGCAPAGLEGSALAASSPAGRQAGRSTVVRACGVCPVTSPRASVRCPERELLCLTGRSMGHRQVQGHRANLLLPFLPKMLVQAHPLATCPEAPRGQAACLTVSTAPRKPL